MLSLSTPLVAGDMRLTTGGIMSMFEFKTMLAVAGRLTLPALSLAQRYTVFVPSPELKVNSYGLAFTTAASVGVPESSVINQPIASACSLTLTSTRCIWV